MVAARKAARHGLRRYGGEWQERSVLIFGGGLLGLYGCSLFKEDGFKVFLSDKSDARREQATKFGAEKTTEEEILTNSYDAVIEVRIENKDNYYFLNLGVWGWFSCNRRVVAS